MEQLKKLFSHLDTLIKNREELRRTCPEVWRILIKESGIFTEAHIPCEVGNLITLWTTGSKWKINKDGDKIYIFAIKAPHQYDVYNIEAYGWSKNQRKIVVIKGLSFTLMLNQAIRVGVRAQSSTADIDKAVNDFKEYLSKIKRKHS